MSEMYTQYCDASVSEHNKEKAKRIVDEMIISDDPDLGKACGSIAWDFYSSGDQTNAEKYGLKGSEKGDRNAHMCLANLYYDRAEYKNAYEYLLKAKAAGEDVSTVENMYKSKADASDKKEGCYIATCVYGSYDCPQVWTLRRYRDEILSSSFPGRVFIKIYYAISPQMVKLFGNTKIFKTFWKKFLDIKVNKLSQMGIENTPYVDRR